MRRQAYHYLRKIIMSQIEKLNLICFVHQNWLDSDRSDWQNDLSQLIFSHHSQIHGNKK